MLEHKLQALFTEIGASKRMVLSTSLDDKVTSRMMSIIIDGGKFYFQTDKDFRKYEQIKGNPHVALCIDNLSIEGICKECGKPQDFSEFCVRYQQYYEGSYNAYTHLERERLFVIEPIYIQRWVYIENKPFVEIFDLEKEIYTLKEYIC